MGASNFFTTSAGKTAEEAFQSARDNAAYWHGHGGYTGTIAEKGDFVMARSYQPGEKPEDFEQRISMAGYLVQREGDRLWYEYRPDLIEDPNVRADFETYHDKWGPCLCIKTADGTWAFLGIASE